MTYNEKKSLYESIMKDVAKIVKKRINEGYYYHNFTQHIIQIYPEEDATVENYKRIAKVLKCFQDIHYNSHMLIHDGIMDDSCWSVEFAGEIIPGAGSKYWEGLS
jgi:hypothetical protein